MGGLNELIGSKKYGGDRLFSGMGRIRELTKTVDLPRLPTGIFPLDYASGGGIPFCVPTHIFGPYGGGKTTLAYLTARFLSGFCVGCLRPVPVCICGDRRIAKTLLCQFEGASLSPAWFETLRYDVDVNMVVALPDTAEQGFEIVESALKADDCGLVIIDSIAAAVSRKELEGSYEDTVVGGTSALISKFMRRATNVLLNELKRGHLVALVILNQLRSNVGATFFQSAEKTPGGWALKHLCRFSIRISQLAGEKDSATNTQSVLRFSASMLGAEAKHQLFIAEGRAEYKLAVRPDAHGYRPGSVMDYKSVVGAASKDELGILEKTNGGYRLVGLEGVSFPKLSELEEVFKTRGASVGMPGLDDVIRWHVLNTWKALALDRRDAGGA